MEAASQQRSMEREAVDDKGVAMMTADDQVRTVEGASEVRTLHSAPLSGTELPTRVPLAPWGTVESTHGEFVVDEESARLVLEAFAAHGTDLPIDYEHQTLGGEYAAPDGKAPAAGWIKRLHAEPGVGLVADIEWTAEAARMLAAREYRYLSPVAIVRREDRRLIAIHSAALTNKPAIVGMHPIVNRIETEADDAKTMALLRTELRLPADADDRQVLLAAGQRLAVMARESQQNHAKVLIEAAARAGKLTPAQRDWAAALIARDERLFAEWLRTAPVIVQPGRTTNPVGDGPRADRQGAVTARARAEFHSHPLLSAITTEEAYVKDALRENQR
jgi:phage I-like protein